MKYQFGVVPLGRQQMKRIFVTITLAAAAAWILAIPAAAQGHSQGHGSAAAGSMGGGHGMDASGNSGSGTSGPRAPGELLTQNKQLSSKLSSLLPAGTDLQAAAMGFRNLGQFVAAVHVSHNLDIPFAQLKCAELATTAACPGMTVPSKSSNLGQAIQTLKPTMSSADSKSAAKQAEKEASADTHS
jgi:hypothetical protein